MSDAVEQYVEDWQPPATFRAALNDLAQIADLLAAEVQGQLLVPASDVDFLARRLARLSRLAYAALPPEVT